MRQHREPQKIIDHRMVMQANGFLTEYRVKWKGLSVDQSTWKAEVDLQESQPLIQAYKRSQARINEGETLIEQKPKYKQTSLTDLFKVHNNGSRPITNNEDFFFQDQSNEMKEEKREPALQIEIHAQNKEPGAVISTKNEERSVEKKQILYKPKSKKQAKEIKPVHQMEKEGIENTTNLEYFLTKAEQVNEHYNYNQHEQKSQKDNIISANQLPTAWRSNQQPQLRKIIRNKDGNQTTVAANDYSFYSHKQKNSPSQYHQNATNCQIISVHARSKTEGPVWYVVKQNGRYREVSEDQLLQTNPLIIQEIINKKEYRTH